jgi:hypothetical protein
MTSDFAQLSIHSQRARTVQLSRSVRTPGGHTMIKVAAGSLATLALCSIAATEAGCAMDVGQGSERTAVEQQAVSTSSFTMSYTAWAGSFFGNGSCSSTSSNNSIKGYEPTTSGTYPVFIFVTGTSMTFDGSVDEDLIQYMGGQGFVAATVQYDNSSYPSSCGPMQAKASCIYNTSSSVSAVSQICSRAKADCTNKGIYVSGFSQGANIGSMAANYGSHMKAAYLIGNGDAASFYNLSGCLDKSHLSFASSQLREVNGESDQFFGNNQAGVQKQLQNVTGDTCASGTYNCLQADGSGWYIVANSQVSDGTADHCYYYNKANSTCSSWSGFDTGWDTGSVTWEKIQDLAWLASK